MSAISKELLFAYNIVTKGSYLTTSEIVSKIYDGNLQI